MREGDRKGGFGNSGTGREIHRQDSGTGMTESPRGEGT